MEKAELLKDHWRSWNFKIYTITSLVYFSYEIWSHLQIHEAHMWKSANILGELPANGGGAAEGLAQPAARPMAAGCSGQSQSYLYYAIGKGSGHGFNIPINSH